MKARGEVLMTDRIELQLAPGFNKGDEQGEVAWRGIIWHHGQLWKGKAHWTRSAAWDEMFMANEAAGWDATLKAPLPDGAPV